MEMQRCRRLPSDDLVRSLCSSSGQCSPLKYYMNRCREPLGRLRAPKFDPVRSTSVMDPHAAGRATPSPMWRRATPSPSTVALPVRAPTAALPVCATTTAARLVHMERDALRLPLNPSRACRPPLRRHCCLNRFHHRHCLWATVYLRRLPYFRSEPVPPESPPYPDSSAGTETLGRSGPGAAGSG